ncbi:MAG: ABC transporter ATP-binding protein [Gammaproteobacteria bacterium]|nr:ABC transporter ATP-binding protein [Gammaproteobacteria bacterium]
MTSVISARKLSKRYGSTQALDNVDLEIGTGRIVGLIGPNGAGKTTALKAILGLTPFRGSLQVLGRDPRRERHALMSETCFITDTAVMPRWIRVRQVLDYVAGVHPKFDRSRAEAFLGETEVRPEAKVKSLSKGMITQLHLALVMAVDARLLVLDEPTLGLDIIYRKQFYTTLLGDYYDGERTILLTTHQVEEVEHILTDLVFINRGRVVLNETVEAMADKYVEVVTRPDQAAAARELHPVFERQMFGRPVFLFSGVERERLAPLGEPRTPSIADLFFATVKGEAA